MAEPDLSLLQTMFQRLLDGQGGLMAELHEIKQRTTSIERHIAGIRRDYGSGHRDRSQSE
jgi:hypothetical protein